MALALAICGMTAIAPMNVSAYEVRTAEHMVIDTEAFQYDSGAVRDDVFETEELGAYLNTDAVDAGFLVTGVYTYEDGNKYYTLFTLNAKAESQLSDGSVEYFENRSYVKAENLEKLLDGKELTAGDIFEFANYGGYGLGDFGGFIRFKNSWISYDGNGNEVENTAQPEYVGNAVEMFGEAFEAVLENEMYLAPNIIIEDRNGYDVTSDNQIVMTEALKAVDTSLSDKVGYIVTGDNQIIKLGDVTIDEAVSIIDVLAVNQALIGVRSLGEYGELAGDVNHNGTLDDGDAIKILKSLAGLETLD